MKRNKHFLPSFYKLKSIQLDPKKLVSNYEKIKNHFTNVYESNKSFCANNHGLAEKVYSHFEQISLTEFRTQQKTPDSKECESLNKNPTGKRETLSKFSLYKLRLSSNSDPRLIEKNYNIPTSLIKNTYFEECLQKFKAPYTRVRIIKLKAGKMLPPHIDYDPSYAVRVIIPIVTNEMCINFIWRKGKMETAFLPADGSAYFLNVGFSHAVVNFGKEDRISLMISLNGQEDLEEIQQYKLI